MSFQHRNRRGGGNFNKGGGRHGGGAGGKRGGKDMPPVDENNPVVKCFREYAQELDEKHDRYERIVKCSRDITIESKRIIFLLHTVDAKKDNLSKVCTEARSRLTNLCQTHFLTIARELHKQDPYQFLRAYTAGLQEFVEAYTFLEYTQSQNISHWSTIQALLQYKVAAAVEEKKSADAMEERDDQNSDGESVEKEPADMIDIRCPLAPMEFVLGVGDLTGEVMRKCINSLGSSDVDSCFIHRCFLQELYKGFVSVSNVRNRDFSQKLFTLRQSLLKSENVCYNVKVRGGEAAKWGSTDDNAFEDEGVFF